MARKSRSAGAATTLRIIGGDWRGRRVAVADAPGLRPTGDRIRETLFNWLAPRIEGARCIDLFAGTGALGLEALSRGAAHVIFVDSHRDAANGIRASLTTLDAAKRATVIQADSLASAWHHHASGAPDLVFIDPPFAKQLHAAALKRIAPLLGAHSRVYLEYPAVDEGAIERALGNGFELLRRKRAGSVGYCLARQRRDSEDSAP